MTYDPVRRVRSTVASWSHIAWVCRPSMATGGLKVVSRALLLAKATIHVLSMNHSSRRIATKTARMTCSPA